jgi:pimeloyl-ACP methyl ester carboxylesterase
MRALLLDDGAKLSYGLTRSGAPKAAVVFLHGMASNMTRWSELLETTNLAAGWDLLRLDLRGHAGSVNRGRIDMARWCQDLVELLDAESLPDAVLVGHCMGANLALQFAVQHPERVRGLVLIEPLFTEALTGTLKRAAQLRAVLKLATRVQRGVNGMGIYRRHLPPLDLKALDIQTRELMARDGVAFPTARYGSVWEDLKHVPLNTYLQDLLAVTAPLPELSGMTAPTLALLSKGSHLTEANKTIARLRTIPDCHIQVLPAAHWIPTELPDTLRELTQQWCARLA